MKAETIRKSLTFAVIALLTAIAAPAQKNCDAFFAQGQKLQGQGRYKEAIVKYQKARACYTSTDKQRLCDNQITLCRKAISNAPGKRRGNNDSKSNTAKQPSLSVSNDHFTLDTYHAKTVTVSVNTENMDSWNATAIPNDNGTSFLTVSKSSDGKSLHITCPQNNSTSDRRQRVEVTGANLKATIDISQAGRPVEITVDNTALTFGRKGGDKTISINSNSTTIYSQNSDKNWYIVSMPEWVSAVIKPKKAKKGGILGKLSDKYNEVVKGEDPDAVDTSTELEIRVDKLVKSNPDYETGRRGVLTIGADDKTVIISIIQK